MKPPFKDLSAVAGLKQSSSGGGGRILLSSRVKPYTPLLPRENFTCEILVLEILCLIFKILTNNSLDDFMGWGRKEREAEKHIGCLCDCFCYLMNPGPGLLWLSPSSLRRLIQSAEIRPCAKPDHWGTKVDTIRLWNKYFHRSERCRHGRPPSFKCL